MKIFIKYLIFGMAMPFFWPIFLASKISDWYEDYELIGLMASLTWIVIVGIVLGVWVL